MKIAVYALARNDEASVDRWIRNTSDADYLVAADLGSTDSTVRVLRANSVIADAIGQAGERFDTARNAAMAMIPLDADVCVSMDIDAHMSSDWRAEIESCWSAGATRMRYTYLTHRGDGRVERQYRSDHIHARLGYSWVGPACETLVATGRETVIAARGLTMFGTAPTGKYGLEHLPLLQLGHLEDPSNANMLFCLAREHAQNNLREEAVEHFKKYLDLASATWPDQRSEAMIWLSRLMPHDRLRWLRSSIVEAPLRREAWIQLADYYYEKNEWVNLYAAALDGCHSARDSRNQLDGSIGSDAKLWDLAGLGAWNIGLKPESLDLFAEAHRLEPDNHRITNNYNTVEAVVKG